jgi:F-type H+-transporting ATPase subunit a
VSSEQKPLDAEAQFTSNKRSRISLRFIAFAIVGLLILNVAAIILLPIPDEVRSGANCEKTLLEADGYPACFIKANLHFPRPHEVWVAGGAEANEGLVSFQVSLTDSLVTMMAITVLVLVLGIIAARGRKDVPGFLQNFVEWTYESLHGFGSSMGGSKAARYIPLFAAFFVLILAFNWSGLVPFISQSSFTRAPTSDLNITLGLALVAFFVFHAEGFRVLGFSGYISKFLPFYEFKKGIGAGLVAFFVGILELILEFIKPVTLSMRLFGNIFGGEVALGVVTGLAMAFLVPVALYGLEIILTFVQALIFATLTLMFILAAVESHEHEEGHMGEESMDALEDARHPAPATS